MSPYDYVPNSPSVYDVYLSNKKSQDPSFLFHTVHDNDAFFRQLIDYVFFPTRFDLTAFEIFIKEKCEYFSVATAGQYALMSISFYQPYRRSLNL